MTRDLVARLEAVEATVIERDMRRRGVTGVARRFGGVLVAEPARMRDCRAFGVTMGTLGPAAVDELVAWFHAHGATPQVQLSSWASTATATALREAGFGPAWSRSVHALDLTTDPAAADADGPPARPDAADAPGGGGVGGGDVEVVAVDDPTAPAFLDTLVVGLRGEGTPTVDRHRDRMAAERRDPGVRHWLARVDGVPAGAAVAQLVDGVVFLGPAATLPGHRRRGAHAAMLAARLAWARTTDADLAFVTSEPTGGTARNVERLGMRLVQQQLVLRGPAPA